MKTQRPKHHAKQQSPPKDSLHIYYCNIDNSIMSKYDEILALNQHAQYDIIALTEIKPKHGDIPEHQMMMIPGYDLHTSNLQVPHSRGTCIYTKSILEASLVQPNVHPTFDDSIWVTIKGVNNSALLIGCIYRSGSYYRAIPKDPDLHHAMEWAAEQSVYSHKLIIGDFNHPSICWNPQPYINTNNSAHNSVHQFLNCIGNTFLHQHIVEPTRYRLNQAPTLDDLLFTNEQEMVQQLEHLTPLGASDHVGLQFNFHISTTSRCMPKKTLKYDKADYTNMKLFMEEQDWNEALSSKDPQKDMDILQEQLELATSKFVPTVTRRPDEIPKPKWMSTNAFRNTRQKHSKWIRFKNTLAAEDYENYTCSRNNSSHLNRKSRISYERRLARETKTNNKAFWSYVNSRRITKPQIPDLKDNHGKYTTSDIEKAEVLNNQYVSVFTKEDTSNMPHFNIKSLITTPLTDIDIDEELVYKHLTNLRIDKSAGPDKMHPRLLKELADVIVEPLTIIFKSSVKMGIVPQQWKDAVVTPIFKKGSKADPANYRPVSLTSIICKLLERIISDAITQHLENNLLTCKEQHGFTKGKSTVTNLTEALDVWTEAVSHNIPVDVIFLDYSKAFDVVPHERLLLCAESLGLQGNILKWIKNFLSNRRQRVAVNGELSNWSTVTSGVPQGSVIGPLLFTLFVSTIPEEVSSHLSMFADDTKIYSPLSVLEDNTHLSCLQQDLDNLMQWTTKMQMKFNPQKCKTMHLGKDNPRIIYSLNHTDGTSYPLESTEEEKDLGVVIDSKLTFTKHVQIQINKANRSLGAVKHTFKFMDKTSFLLLYKSLIRPYLEYASVVWSPKSKRDSDDLERVQRRATRIVPSLAGLDYEGRLRALHLPTLQYRRERTDMIQLYKINKGIDKVKTDQTCGECANTTLKRSLATNTRGHTEKYQVQRCTGIRCNFFTERALHDWNKLTQVTVDSTSVNIFKNRLSHEWYNRSNFYEYRFSY